MGMLHYCCLMHNDTYSVLIVPWSRDGAVFLVLNHFAMSSLLPCPDSTDAHHPLWGPGAPYPQNGVPFPRIHAYSLPMVRTNPFKGTVARDFWPRVILDESTYLSRNLASNPKFFWIIGFGFPKIFKLENCFSGLIKISISSVYWEGSDTPRKLIQRGLIPHTEISLVVSDTPPSLI